MSFSSSASSLEKRIAKSSQVQIEQELFQAADKRIAELNKTGVAQGLTDLSEPKSQHLPVLIDMGDFDGWTHKDLADKGGKMWELETDRRLRRINKELTREKIEVNDILKDVVKQDGSSKKCRHVMLIGPAGSGKTTLLKRIAKYASQGKYEMLKDKLLINADLRTFPVDKKILPSQGLLGSTFSDWESEKMDQRYQWVLNNSEKVGFFVDSLDTLPFDLNSERPPIAFNEPTTPDVILHNLLAKELFPKSFIVSSSREFKVRNMHPTVRPDRCILLDGLEQESVKDLIDGFLGKDKGAEMKKYIDNECPEIWPLLSIPVFLVFSTISFAQDGFKPKTMSGILIKYFLCLIHSPHAQEKEILSVLCKLMPMSFEAICKGQVLFALEDLIQFGLTPDLVRDLTSLIPQSHGTGLSSKLMQKDRFFLYFNHQTQQETLSALHVLSLEMKEFKDFVQFELYVETFGVVRRLVFGILLNDEVLEAAKELTEIADIGQKKIILLESLRTQLKQGDSEELLELFIDLNEAKEAVGEVIRSTMHDIDLEHISLSPSDIQAVGFVMRHCEQLGVFDLGSCNLNARKMEIIDTAVMQSQLKLQKLDVSSNNNIGSGGMFYLGRFVKNSTLQELSAANCSLEPEHLQKFAEGAENTALKKLDVSRNRNIGSGGMFYLGRFLQNSTLQELSAISCDLKPEHLEKFAEGAENTTLKKFDISGNENIGSGGMFLLGKFLKDSTLEELEARLCGLGPEHLQKFAEGAENTTFRKLDVSYNEELGPEGMHLLGKLVKDHEVEEVCARGCNPNEENVQKFAEGLGEAKFDSLDLSRRWNPTSVYVRSLLNLLPRVNKKIKLQGWEINEIQQREIQDKLNEICSPTLSITLGENKNQIELKARISEKVRKAKVLFDYESVEDDELTLKVGEIIIAVKDAYFGWFEGLLNGKRGIFPGSFVEMLKEEKEKKDQALPAANKETIKKMRKAKVLFDCEPAEDDEFRLKVGDIITEVEDADDELWPGGWCTGLFNGKRGVFLGCLVEILQEEKEKMGPALPAANKETRKESQLKDDADSEVKNASCEDDDKSESITSTEESKDSAEAKNTEITDETSTSGTGILHGTLFASKQSNDETQLGSTISGELDADRQADEKETSDEASTSGTSYLISPGTSIAPEKYDDKTKSESTSAAGADAGYGAVETGANAEAIPDAELWQQEFQYSQLDADKEIGPKGGDVTVDECSLTIPPKSLVDTEKLSVGMSMNFRNLGLPADRVPISPCLKVKFGGKLRIPAKARVPTWYKASKGSQHAIKIYKRNRDEENNLVWRELEIEVKVYDDIIEFEVDHFCWFIALIKEWLWGYGEMKLTHGLFHLGPNFQSVVCYRSPESIFENAIARLEKFGYKGIYENYFLMNTKQGVPVRMECVNELLHKFKPQQYILSPSAIKANPTVKFPFLLQHLKELTNEVEIEYIVDDFSAPLAVKLLSAQAPQRQPGLMRVTTTEIEGAGPIRDLHLLGTGNTHDHRQYPNDHRQLPQEVSRTATAGLQGRDLVDVAGITNLNVTCQAGNFGSGALTLETHGGSQNITNAPQPGNEFAEQNVPQQGGSGITAAIYNKGEIKLKQYDTNTQVFRK